VCVGTGRAMRPPALWLASLALFYSGVGGGLGEAWSTHSGLLRAAGVLLVLAGILWYSTTLAAVRAVGNGQGAAPSGASDAVVEGPVRGLELAPASVVDPTPIPPSG
jgi:hypothetical protein